MTVARRRAPQSSLFRGRSEDTPTGHYDWGLIALFLMLLCIGLLLLADLCKRRGIVLRQVVLRQDWWCRYVLIAGAILALLVFGKWGPGFNQASFIYFQF